MNSSWQAGSHNLFAGGMHVVSTMLAVIYRGLVDFDLLFFSGSVGPMNWKGCPATLSAMLIVAWTSLLKGKIVCVFRKKSTQRNVCVSILFVLRVK